MKRGSYHPSIQKSTFSFLPFSFPVFPFVLLVAHRFAPQFSWLSPSANHVQTRIKFTFFDIYTRQGRMAEEKAISLQALQGYGKAWR